MNRMLNGFINVTVSSMFSRGKLLRSLPYIPTKTAARVQRDGVVRL